MRELHPDDQVQERWYRAVEKEEWLHLLDLRDGLEHMLRKVERLIALHRPVGAQGQEVKDEGK